MPTAPRIVPVGIPVDALAIAAYMSYAVTRLKNEEGLDPEKRPEDQVPPFKDLSDAEKGGWLAAAQGVLSCGAMTFAVRSPDKLAIDLGVITAEEIVETYPIRQAEDGNIRFPSTPDAGTWQMFGRITAKILAKAQLTVPAVVTQGILKRLIGPADGDVKNTILEAVVAVEIPRDCYNSLLEIGFKDGEVVTLGILDPSTQKSRPHDAMLEQTKGEAH